MNKRTAREIIGQQLATKALEDYAEAEWDNAENDYGLSVEDWNAVLEEAGFTVHYPVMGQLSVAVLRLSENPPAWVLEP